MRRPCRHQALHPDRQRNDHERGKQQGQHRPVVVQSALPHGGPDPHGWGAHRARFGQASHRRRPAGCRGRGGFGPLPCRVRLALTALARITARRALRPLLFHALSPRTLASTAAPDCSNHAEDAPTNPPQNNLYTVCGRLTKRVKTKQQFQVTGEAQRSAIAASRLRAPSSRAPSTETADVREVGSQSQADHRHDPVEIGGKARSPTTATALPGRARACRPPVNGQRSLSLGQRSLSLSAHPFPCLLSPATRSAFQVRLPDVVCLLRPDGRRSPAHRNRPRCLSGSAPIPWAS